MKNVFLYISILLSGFAALAQNENNHWQLGQTDLNFSTNPNTVNTVSTIPAGNYGLASISDASGNLLFYTNGKTIWNKNHAVMQNGSNLTDFPESLQQAIIIPHPGASNKYYVFRQAQMPCTCIGSQTPGYYVYSIVDFSNNNLGELLQINSAYDSSKGENLYSTALRDNDDIIEHLSTYSPLTFTKGGTGDYYWVVVQDENRILSYKLDVSGFITIPVISTFSLEQVFHPSYRRFDGVTTGIQRSVFRITTSTSGVKLYGLESAIQTSTDPADNGNLFYRLNFNNNTGQFSNFQSISFGYIGAVTYDFELSPDELKAYGVQYKINNWTTPSLEGQIIVKDLSNTSIATRLLNEYSSPTIKSSGFTALQKDRYGNLLVSSTSTNANKNKYLHKIENPDSFANSSVQLNILYLNDKSISAFPQLIPHVTHFCEENIVLSTAETNNSFEYQAGTSVTTNNAYTINAGADIVFKAGGSIFLKSNTLIKDGSLFLAQISECPEGRAAGARFADTEEIDTETQSAFSDNRFFSLSPNPAITAFTVTSQKDIQHITVTSFDGKMMFNRDVKDKTTSYTIDTNGYTQGIYTVTILTQTGETQTQKLIKN